MKSDIDFDIISEPLIRHELSDGSHVETWFVLDKVEKVTSGNESRYNIFATPTTKIYTHERFRGPPDSRDRTKEEQMRAIEEDNIRARAVDDKLNEYRIDGNIIKIHTRIAKAARTKLYSKTGGRVYMLNIDERVESSPEVQLSA